MAKKTPMTQEAADRIKRTAEKKPDGSKKAKDFAERAERAAKRNDRPKQ